VSYASCVKWLLATLKSGHGLGQFGPNAILLGDRGPTNPVQDEIRIVPLAEQDVESTRTQSVNTRKPLTPGGTTDGSTLTCKWSLSIDIYLREQRTEQRILGGGGRLGELDALANVKSAIENAFKKNDLLKALEFGAATFVRDPDAPRVSLPVIFEEEVLACNRLENVKEVA